MFTGKLAFAQVMDFLPLHTFRRCVQRYPSNYPTKTFSHLDQFLCMAFAQLTFRDSLRDIEVCLRAHASKLYHLGIRGYVARSTLADANEKRDWRTREKLRSGAGQAVDQVLANFVAELFTILHPATLPMLERMFEDVKQDAETDGEWELKRRAEIGIAAARIAAREQEAIEN